MFVCDAIVRVDCVCRERATVRGERRDGDVCTTDNAHRVCVRDFEGYVLSAKRCPRATA